MKFFLLILSFAAVIFLGGFAYFALTDVKIETSKVSKTIPNERFFNEG